LIQLNLVASPAPYLGNEIRTADGRHFSAQLNIAKFYGRVKVPVKREKKTRNSPCRMIIVFFTSLMHIFIILIHFLHPSTCFEHYYAHPQEVKCVLVLLVLLLIQIWPP